MPDPSETPNNIIAFQPPQQEGDEEVSLATALLGLAIKVCPGQIPGIIEGGLFSDEALRHAGQQLQKGGF